MTKAWLLATVFAIPALARAPDWAAQLPTGQYLTPTAAAGANFQLLNPQLANYPNYRAGQAGRVAVSPDGKTLLVLTSGYNRLNNSAGQQDPAASNEYVFVYDITGANEAAPAPRQVLQVPNAFFGLVWSPDSTKFYVSGGVSDAVFVFSQPTPGTWAQSGTIALGHQPYGSQLKNTKFALLTAFLSNGIGFLESATAAGLAITPDGATLVVANAYNDSISVINTASGTVEWEYGLRPFVSNPAQSGVAGGETPFSVAIKGTAQTGYTAYIGSIRDREIVAVPIGAKPPAGSAVSRIKLPGNPNFLALSADQATLYATQDNSDSVAVISTASNTVTGEIDARAPSGGIAAPETYTGTAPNSLALLPGGGELFVTLGGANAVSVAQLAPSAQVVSQIPTGWYPHDVAVSADGKYLYVVNGKSDPGPNPQEPNPAANQYVLQSEPAGLLTVPVASASPALTAQVAANDFFNGSGVSQTDEQVMAALRLHIKHVIYIIKENRTFDQILGDLGNGSNGDSALTMFGASITPNFHGVAKNFVTLDNFYCAGEVSGNGWSWSTQARESDWGVKTIPVNYAGRGSSNDSEGSNRIVDVGLSTAQRIAAFPTYQGFNLYALLGGVLPGGYANLLPGNNDDFATDGPGGAPPQAGHLWDAALRAGLSVRDYGFFVDIVRYNIPTFVGGIPLIQNPAATKTQVAWPTNPALAPYTDPYFRGFDNAFPDYWRWQEWAREFQGYVQNRNLPALSLVRLMHDHTGNFCTAPPPYTAPGCPALGLNTPELQQADNDYAVGLLIDTVAHSPYASNTLIFVLEDDAQDGPDHVDAHRSTAYVVGPYVKQGAVVSTHYSTVNMVRTIEDVLGIDHLNLNDALQPPMTDVFDLTKPYWSFSASPSAILNGTGEASVPAPGKRVVSTHDGAWWAARTKGFDWSSEDRVPADRYNRILWEGLKGGAPYPATRGGGDR